MHDIDRVQFEENFAQEYGETPWAETEYFETAPFTDEALGSGTSDPGCYRVTTAVLCENSEMELAMEMLESTDETKLESSIGQVMHRAEQAGGVSLPSSLKPVLGGLLKGAARRMLPFVASMPGGIASRFGAAGTRPSVLAAGRLLGLELEGLSGEDQEFEVARRFVRFAGETVRNAVAMSGQADPRQTGQQALLAAARTYAPGLIGPESASHGHASGPAPVVTERSGRWMRRGHKIILYGV